MVIAEAAAAYLIDSPERSMARGYKQTEVGQIPEDWSAIDYVALGEVIDGDRGIHYPSAGELRDSGDCLFLNAKNVTQDGFQFSDCQFISADKDKKLNNGKLTRGDIVLTTRGTVGNFAFFNDEVPYEHVRINSGMVILRSASLPVSNAYLYLVFRSQIILSQIERMAFGSAQPQLTVKGISGLKIPIPPTQAEQAAITETLNDVGSFIESLEQLLTKKRAIKQGAMQDLLTGKQRLPGFSQQWDVATLEHSQLSSRKAQLRRRTVSVGRNLVSFFLRSECVSPHGLDLSESMFISDLAHSMLRRSEVAGGDILMTITGNVGRVIQLPADFGQANINQHIARIRIISPAMCGGFVAHVLKQDAYRKHYTSILTGQAYPQISLKQVRETTIPAPELEEQIAISAVLSDMDSEVDALESKLAKARQLKQGMMQELLTGRVRLV